MTPLEVGKQIRKLLLGLYVPGHTEEDELKGTHNYGTDALRREALDYAGLCWLAPGEMAPGCACDWSEENPEAPRQRLVERLGDNDNGWSKLSTQQLTDIVNALDIAVRHINISSPDASRFIALEDAACGELNRRK